MDAILTPWVALHQDQQVNGVAAGQTAAAQKTVTILITTRSVPHREAVTDFLDGQAIAYTLWLFDAEYIHVRTTVPVALLPRLAAFPGVLRLYAKPRPYPNLPWGANVLLAKYETGLMPDEDDNPTYAFLGIGIDHDHYDAVKRQLKSKGLIMVQHDRFIEAVLKPGNLLTVYASVSQLAALDGMANMTVLGHWEYPVPASEVYTQPYPSWLQTPTPTRTPAPTPTPSDGGSGSAINPPPTSTA